MKKLFVPLTLISLSVFGLSSPAGASFVYSLGVGNAALGGFPAPFGTATVTLLDPTHARVEFASNDVGGFSYLFGGPGAIAFNVNANSYSVTEGPYSNRFPGFTPLLDSFGGSENEDVFGLFGVISEGVDGYANTLTNASYDITNFSGIFWASDSEVLAANALGNHIAAQIFATTFPADPGSEPLAIGFAADTGVPEPASMLLLGLGLAGLGAARRRRKV